MAVVVRGWGVWWTEDEVWLGDGADEASALVVVWVCEDSTKGQVERTLRLQLFAGTSLIGGLDPVR